MVSVIIAMCVFSLTMSISPGPVNITIVSTGATYGFRRTMPFVSGATIGFVLLLLALGLGLMPLVMMYPASMRYLAVAGSLFIMFVGFKIATAREYISASAADCPSFRQGMLMQWLNPKAWMAGIAGISMFADATSHMWLPLFAGIYFWICFGSLTAWAVIGWKCGLLLKTSGRMRVFNMVAGFLLLLCAAYVLSTTLSGS